jgi:hypothetical protein
MGCKHSRRILDSVGFGSIPPCNDIHPFGVGGCMNERIKELAEQIGFIPDPFLANFAELIVKECVDIVDREVPGMIGVAAMKKIYEHFGVEE